MKTIIFICTLFSLSAMAQKGITKDKYPQTKMGDQQDVFFGATVKDPYRWLEEEPTILTR